MNVPWQDLHVIFEILWVNLALSGDNAVAIGLVSGRVPPRHRVVALALTALLATVLRVALTGSVALVLAWPGAHLLGGLLLVAIGVRLLTGEPDAPEAPAASLSIGGAILLILVADSAMSLDNVLAVAALSGGSLGLLAIGLAVSIAITVMFGTMVGRAMERLWWIAYLAAAVIAWTASRMFVDDGLVAAWIGSARPARWAVQAAVLVLVLSAPRWWPWWTLRARNAEG